MKQKLTERQSRGLRVAADIAYQRWGVTVTDADWASETIDDRLVEAGLTGDDLRAAATFLAIGWGLNLPPHRPAGRPRWPPELFRSRLQEALEATAPPRTTDRVAANFRRLDGTTGIDPASLRRLCRRHEAVLPGSL